MFNVLICLACLPDGAALGDLRKAESLRIGYTVGGQAKTLVVTDAKEVKGFLDALTVSGVERGIQAGIYPFGKVDFVLPGGEVVRTIFVDTRHLDRARWGQIYLKDGKFYEKVNEAISKAEGKKIDVLERN